MRRLIGALLALAAMPVMAQNTDIEALSGLQFNFGNPGARSLAMGGAFLGLADDASAAEANPAGLTILRKPEVSIELRNYLEKQLFTTSGTFPDIERTAFTNHSDRVVVTFGSAVMPIKNFTVGVYYHEPLRNEGGGAVVPFQDPITGRITPLPNFYLPKSGPESDPVFGDPVTKAQCEQIRIEQNNPFACVEYPIDPFLSALSVRQRTYAITGAWQIHPRFSVGASVRHQRFLETAATFRFNSNFTPKHDLIQATARVNDDGTIDVAEESDTTFSAGFKWAPTDKISFGGVYKLGAEYDTPLFFSSPETNFEVLKVADTTFHMPDIAGIGVSIRPLSTLTINVDAVNVKYSNLVDNFVTTAANVAELEDPFRVNDVTEIRIGAEYLFATKIPFALRAGYWRDPKHSVEYNGPLNHFNFIAQALLFPEGEDQDHISFGGGLAWQRFQIDAAYDTSKNYKVGSISMVTRF